jgi:phospholipid N-methyltransferase
VFTRELRNRFPEHQVVAIEFNDLFAQRLRDRMSDVTVVTGCASQIRMHLDVLGIPVEKVGAVISGLPLLSLPRALSTNIFNSIADVLEPGQRYVQFTYSKRMWRRFQPPGFRFNRSHLVLLNFPRALVMPFTRIASSDVPFGMAS